jgi:hypothetical protein
MQSIWKFPFEIADNFSLRMPKEAKPISVQMQGQIPCMWAMDKEVEEKKFIAILIGWNFEAIDSNKYIGTLQERDTLVWHIFEK